MVITIQLILKLEFTQDLLKWWYLLKFVPVPVKTTLNILFWIEFSSVWLQLQTQMGMGWLNMTIKNLWTFSGNHIKTKSHKNDFVSNKRRINIDISYSYYFILSFRKLCVLHNINFRWMNWSIFNFITID